MNEVAVLVDSNSRNSGDFVIGVEPIKLREFASELNVDLDLPAEELIRRGADAIGVAERLNIAAGLVLLRARELCNHGEFLNYLSQHDIPSQRASEHMAIAGVLLRTAPDDRKKLLRQPKTVTLGIARMDDEVRQHFLDTGELDERLTLQEYKSLLKRRDQEIQLKEEHIKRLDAQLSRSEAVGKKALDAVTPLSVAHLRREASAYAQEALACMHSFASLRERLADLGGTDADDWVQPVAASFISLLLMVHEATIVQLERVAADFALKQELPDLSALSLAVPGPEEAAYIRQAMTGVLIGHETNVQHEEYQEYLAKRTAAGTVGAKRKPPTTTA